jgi:amino acid transporter
LFKWRSTSLTLAVELSDISGGLSMAELGTMITKSGGEYTYIRMGLAEWLAYLWAWTQCFLLKVQTIN